MFHRKRHVHLHDDDRTQGTLERLAQLTDRLENATQALTDLVADLYRPEQGADHD
jgi:hypothetical protein